jgi:hypothetical protein
MQTSEYPETLKAAAEQREYMKGHKERILEALTAVIGKEISDIGPPSGVFTGVGEISIVYLFTYGQADELRRYIAKFELHENDRFDKENEAAEAVRRDYPLPQILLPIYSKEYDEVNGEPAIILYNAAHDFVHTREIADLGQYLSKQLSTNVDNCLNAISYVQDVLTNLHSNYPGRRIEVDAASQPIKWSGSFSFSESASEGLEIAAAFAMPGVDWESAPADVTELVGRWLPNPIHPVDVILSKSTGVVKLSMIHGDLNASNVLVTIGNRQEPRETYFIDISHAAKSEISARDFARLEVDFWGNIFPLFCGSNDPLQTQVLISDILNGSEPAIEEPWPAPILSFLKLLIHWRQATYKNLDIGRDALPREYFFALYFSHLKKLSYGRHGAELQSFGQAEARKRLSTHVVGAALALEMINAIETGELTSERLSEIGDLGKNEGLIKSIPILSPTGQPIDPNSIPIRIELTDEGAVAEPVALSDLVVFARQFPGSGVSEERIELTSPRYAQFVYQRTALLKKENLEPRDLKAIAKLEADILEMERHHDFVYAGLQVLVFDAKIRFSCARLGNENIAANAVNNFVIELRGGAFIPRDRLDRRLIHPSYPGSGYHLYLTDNEYEEWVRGISVADFDLTAKAERVLPALLVGMLRDHNQITETDLELLYDVDSWTVHIS